MLLSGSILDRAPGRTYTTTLGFAELSLRAPLPRAATLTAWRSALPKDFALALRAPKNAVVSAKGPLRVDAAVEASLAWVLEAAQALEVRAVVFATPADLTPGGRSQDLLASYVERLPKVPNRHYVWAPRGVWEPEDTEPLCAKLGLSRAFDPLETPRPAGPFVYAELRALGHRKSFSQSALQDALEVIASEEYDEAFISVDAERGFDVAKRIMKIAAELGLADGSAIPSRERSPDGEGGDDDEHEREDDEDSDEDDEDDEDSEDEDDDET